MNVRPIQFLAAEQRLQGERPEEPPKDSIRHAPGQAGAVATDLALKQHAERDSNKSGKQIMQRLAQHSGCGTTQRGDRPAADDARQKTTDDCTRKTERRQDGTVAPPAQGSEHQAERRSEAENVSGQVRKIVALGYEGARGLCGDYLRARGE